MTGPTFIRIVPAGRDLPVRPGGSAIAAAPEPGPNAVELDPFLFPPPNSTPINVAVNTATAGAGQIIPNVAAYTVPNNCYGVISSIDLLLDSILISSSVLWTFMLNGRPLSGFSPLTILGRNGAASVSKSWAGPLRILIPLGGTFSVQIQNVDGAPYTAGTSYYGWFVPQTRATSDE